MNEFIDARCGLREIDWWTPTLTTSTPTNLGPNLEFSLVDVEQQKKQYHFEIKGAKVFASANDINRLSKPLQSRIRKLFLPRYDEIQFVDVSVKVLKNINDSLARYIGSTVFKNGGDIGDVISIGKLVRKSDGPEQIELIIKTMSKYGMEKSEE